MEIKSSSPVRLTTHRPAQPHCPECKTGLPLTTLLTSMVLYFRCDTCGNIWTVERPAASHS